MERTGRETLVRKMCVCVMGYMVVCKVMILDTNVYG